MIKFSKFHGFGNDYVVIEAEQLRDVIDIFEFTKRFCHRNLGVGSDGIAILEKLNEANADFSCRIINPDGSEAGFSGNGTRCAVAYAYFNGLWDAENLRLRMNTGVKNYRLIEEMSAGHYWFEAEIGKPKFGSDEIPILTETKLDSVINYQLSLISYQFEVSCVNVGNPVACVFVDNFDFDWREVGRKMEVHEKFPAGQISFLSKFWTGKISNSESGNVVRVKLPRRERAQAERLF